MSEKDLAKEHAERAARQAKHAAHNVAEAASHEKDAVVEDINKAAAPINPQGAMSVVGDLGGGFFSLLGSFFLAATAVQKFRAAYEGRGKLTSG